MRKESFRQGFKAVFARPSKKNLYPWLIERGLYAAFLNCMAFIMREWFALMFVATLFAALYVYEFLAKGR